MSATVRLSLPAALDYDLYVYSACSGTLLGSSTNGAGAVDTVNVCWSDRLGVGCLANCDDTMDLLIHVLFYSGNTCDNHTCCRSTATRRFRDAGAPARAVAVHCELVPLLTCASRGDGESHRDLCPVRGDDPVRGAPRRRPALLRRSLPRAGPGGRGDGPTSRYEQVRERARAIHRGLCPRCGRLRPR